MTDLHTHILPGMDDGARSAEESIHLLRLEWEQGVRRVALTPHFYPQREGLEEFLHRREQSWQRLQEAIAALPEKDRQALPAMFLGAEVAWQPNTGYWEELERLRIGEKGPVLVELPFQSWSGSMLRQLYDLVCRSSATVALAHLDRYIKTQKKEYIRELYDMGIPIQLSADRLSRFFDRRETIALLKQEKPFFLASDCHDPTSRPPCMGQAAKVVKKALGEESAGRILRRGEEFFPL